MTNEEINDMVIISKSRLLTSDEKDKLYEEAFRLLERISELIQQAHDAHLIQDARVRHLEWKTKNPQGIAQSIEDYLGETPSAS